MASAAEKRAAEIAAKAAIMPHVPEMAQSYVTDALVMDAVVAALDAAERVRARALPPLVG